MLMAPIAPFYADRLFSDLNRATKRHTEESVHLAEFPIADESLIDKALEARMSLAERITSLTLSLRKKADIKVRQPLNHIMVAAGKQDGDAIASVSDLVKGEVNVKEIKVISGADGILVKKIKPDFKKLGPKCGKAMKQVAAMLTSLTQEQIAAFEEKGSVEFDMDGSSIEISTSEVEIYSEDIPGWMVANDGNLTVALDITLNDELLNEGTARELVNRIQNMRKSSGFEITDKINVVLSHNPKTDAALAGFSDYVAAQVLANSIAVSDSLPAGSQAIDMDGEEIRVSITKV